VVAGKRTDLTVEILKQIRDEIRRTNERLDATRTELSERMEKLERRQTETEIRLASELTAVVGAVHGLKDALLQDRQLRQTVDNHESRIAALERRAG
jgi:DNA-binding Lrp family transcriptional regulator